jgi:antitoxin component of RelBE/YafQ-DinJ toxin-antitoxin module
MEQRTARLTILIDPRKKKMFEDICARQDLTPSQVVRKLIRQYVIDNAGDMPLPDWLDSTTPVEREAKTSRGQG